MEIDGCVVPEDRLYDLENGVWWLDLGNGTAQLGVLASFASFIGRVERVTYRPMGVEIDRGRSVGMLESLRFTGPIRIPVDGTIIEGNPALLERPKLINNAPYSEGWIARVRPREAAQAARELATAPAIETALRDQIRTLRIRCFPATPDAEIIEIGAECAAILARLDEELEHRAAGEVVMLVTDDATSPIEMVRWSDQTGNTVLAHRVEENLHQFLVRRSEAPRARRTRG